VPADPGTERLEGTVAIDDPLRGTLPLSATDHGQNAERKPLPFLPAKEGGAATARQPAKSPWANKAKRSGPDEGKG
jgi:hypothetical protein